MITYYVGFMFENIKYIAFSVLLIVNAFAAEILIEDSDHKECTDVSVVFPHVASESLSPIALSDSVEGYATLDTVFERVIGLGLRCTLRAGQNLGLFK